jgi:hypothetical protein
MKPPVSFFDRASGAASFLATRLALVLASALVAATVNDVVEIGFEHRAWAAYAEPVPSPLLEPPVESAPLDASAYEPSPIELLRPSRVPRDVHVEILRNGEQMTLHYRIDPGADDKMSKTPLPPTFCRIHRL